MNYEKTTWQNGDIITAEKLNNIEDGVESNSYTQALISDGYDSTSTYAIGDYCIYENALYKCNTAINTAEEWNSAHWTAVKIDSEIKAAASSGGGSPSSRPVITAEYDETDSMYHITSHTYDELVTLYNAKYFQSSGHISAIINFIGGPSEDHSGREWYCTDVDCDTNQNPYNIYLGYASIGGRPTNDREATEPAINKFMVSISSNNLDAAGHPTMSDVATSEWSMISTSS